jgi:fatty-acid peroxygenase
MVEIPSDGRADSSLAVLTDPYNFIGKRCQELGTKVFRTRLMLQSHICMMGRDATQLFCDEEHFTRAGAILKRIERSLFGEGGAQGLDGEAHRRRKQFFNSLLTPEESVRIAERTEELWRAAARRWEDCDSVALYDEAREVICRAICAWAGVPVEEADFGPLTRDLASLYEYAASVGPRHMQARAARSRRERWAAAMIEDIRRGNLHPPAGSALDILAAYPDIDGRPLAPQIAAVELLNLLRPPVAVSVYIVFAALAMHRHPECRERFATGDPEYAEMFAQEVRRYFPFFPVLAALTKHDFEWRGYHFPKGTTTVLGLHATNHDPEFWGDPENFRPERFQDWNDEPFGFIPQGGGDPARHHRCPGDRLAVELTKTALHFLVDEVQFEVLPQDLRLPMMQLPPIPHSRFAIGNVRASVAVA